MDPSRADHVLDEWSAVATTARPAPHAPRPRPWYTGFRALAVVAAAVVVVALAGTTWLGRPGDRPVAGALPTASPTQNVTPTPIPTPAPSAIASPSVAPTAAATPTPAPTPRPTATPSPTPACDPTRLHARIVSWNGAAGQRTASVELANDGPAPCAVDRLPRPQLVDANGKVLIDGTTAPSGTTVDLQPGATLTTMVQAGNYCGPTPAAPVTVAFVETARRIVAAPAADSTDAVPPCNGPGQPGQITMHPWGS